MDIQDAKKLLQSYAHDDCLRLSKHCRERMAERNVTTDDFLQVIFWGEIVNFTEDEEHQNHSCEIKGKDINGDDLTLQVAILEKEYSILCITVYG